MNTLQIFFFYKLTTTSSINVQICNYVVEESSAVTKKVLIMGKTVRLEPDTDRRESKASAKEETHRIIQSLRLGKTSKIIQTNCPAWFLKHPFLKMQLTYGKNTRHIAIKRHNSNCIKLQKTICFLY